MLPERPFVQIEIKSPRDPIHRNDVSFRVYFCHSPRNDWSGDIPSASRIEATTMVIL